MRNKKIANGKMEIKNKRKYKRKHTGTQAHSKHINSSFIAFAIIIMWFSIVTSERSSCCLHLFNSKSKPLQHNRIALVRYFYGFI